MSSSEEVAFKNLLILIINYILHYSSRTNRGGGVALYVNKSLQIRPREDLSIFQENVVESLFIEVMLHRKTLIVGVVHYNNNNNNGYF